MTKVNRTGYTRQGKQAFGEALRTYTQQSKYWTPALRHWKAQLVQAAQGTDERVLVNRITPEELLKFIVECIPRLSFLTKSEAIKKAHIRRIRGYIDWAHEPDEPAKDNMALMHGIAETQSGVLFSDDGSWTRFSSVAEIIEVLTTGIEDEIED